MADQGNGVYIWDADHNEFRYIGQVLGGTTVEANPSGATTGDLSKIGIAGTIYNISGLPDYSQASQNDVLTIGQSGPEWTPSTGGGNGAFSLPFSGNGYIGEIYDSNNELVWDRNNDTDFTFQGGSSYKLRLYASTAKALFDLKGKSMFLTSGHITFTRYFAVPDKFTVDWSNTSSYLADLGTTDYSYILPETIEYIENINAFSNTTGYSTLMVVKESGDALDVVLNKLKFVVDLQLTFSSTVQYSKSSTVEFKLTGKNALQNYKFNTNRVIGL